MSDVHQWTVARLENDRKFFFLPIYRPYSNFRLMNWKTYKYFILATLYLHIYFACIFQYETSVIHLYWCKRQNSCFLKMYTAGSECFAFVLKSYIGSLHLHVDHILTVRLIVPFSLVSQPLHLTLTLDNRPGDFV